MSALVLDTANTFALFGIIASLFAVFIAIRANNKQLNAQSYIAFTQKYDSLIASMPKEYWRKREEKEFVFPNPKDNEDLSNKVHNYFQLCCQQFYLHQHSLISDNIWKMWEREISYNLRLNSFKIVWETEEIKYFKLYPEFKKYVKNLHTFNKGKNIV